MLKTNQNQAFCYQSNYTILFVCTKCTQSTLDLTFDWLKKPPKCKRHIIDILIYA